MSTMRAWDASQNKYVDVTCNSAGNLLTGANGSSTTGALVVDALNLVTDPASTSEQTKKDITAPTVLPTGGKFSITIENTVTKDMTINIYSKFPSASKYSIIISYTVPASTIKTILVDGWMLTGFGALSVTPSATGTGVVNATVRSAA